MSPRTLAAALVVALFALTPASAFADPTEQQALAIANRAWPGSPCAGRLTVNWVPTSRLLPDAGGQYEFNGCVVLVDQQFRGTTTGCDYEVHEAWHASGHPEHTANGSVSDFDAGNGYPTCHVKQSKRQQVVALIRKSLPLDGSTRPWHITCAPGLARCRATAPGTHERRYVTDLAGGVGVERV